MMSVKESMTTRRRLQPGMNAPAFSLLDVFGEPVQLESCRGGPLLLSFYRYASCPLCNLRVHELLRHHERWQRRGLRMLAVFESPADHIRRYLDRHDLPFPVLPDPDRRLYHQYGVQPSWSAMLRVMTHHLPMVYDAIIRKGFLPGRMDGDWAMVPADFLIGSDLRIAKAFYGRHIGDHMPIADIETFLDQAIGAGAGPAPTTHTGDVHGYQS